MDCWEVEWEISGLKNIWFFPFKFFIPYTILKHLLLILWVTLSLPSPHLPPSTLFTRTAFHICNTQQDGGRMISGWAYDSYGWLWVKPARAYESLKDFSGAQHGLLWVARLSRNLQTLPLPSFRGERRQVASDFLDLQGTPSLVKRLQNPGTCAPVCVFVCLCASLCVCVTGRTMSNPTFIYCGK